MLEDGCYYIEDTTYCCKISFSEISFVEPDAFFTENCVVLAKGSYKNEQFYLEEVYQPPLHANKAMMFKINEQDYFGSYTRMTEALRQNRLEGSFNETVKLPPTVEESNYDPCIVIVNQIEIDQARQYNAIKSLFQGLESMKPEMLVLVGKFISNENNESATHEQLRDHFEQLGSVVRDLDLEFLRDKT